MSWLASLRHTISRVVDAWTAFWFTPQDPLSLGVCRFLVGAMMVYAHIVWGLNLEGFFGPDGWQSIEAIQAFFSDDWLPSLWWYVPEDQLRLVHLICLVPLMMFMLGLCTSLSSVLALVITISNSNRAPLANYGMDQILTMLGLYLMIAGSGDRFSLDAWWRRRRIERQTGLRWKAPATSRTRLATRLIQVHYCVIYFFAGISKLQGDAWWNGEAVWMAFANQEYQSIDMTWLAHYPWITQMATHGTVLWEVSFPFLVWNRTLRPFVLLIGVAMHAGIGLCMGMITFGLIAVFGYLAFVPPERMQTLLGIGDRFFNKQRRDRDERPSQKSAALSVDLPVAPQSPTESVCEELPSERVAVMNEAPLPIALCDPGWKHRQLAHYLARRGYRPFVTVSPDRVWTHVEQQRLRAVVLFVDALPDDERTLLLEDLTLSPICQLPLVVVSQQPARLARAAALGCPCLHTVQLPASYGTIRSALERGVRQAKTRTSPMLTVQHDDCPESATPRDTDHSTSSPQTDRDR